MPRTTPSAPSTARGVVVSVGASALFAGIYFLPEVLHTLTPNEFFAWRIVGTVPVLTLILLALGEWRAVKEVARRVRRAPTLALVLIVDSALLGIQLWLFGWAPKTGHGLDVALGYFLMPLVMVLVGVTLHRERLSILRITAVFAATVGVAAMFIAGGQLSIPTLMVAFGYPVYFVIRRKARLDSTGALWFELVLLVPVSIVFLAQGPDVISVVQQPDVGWPLLVLAVTSGIALAGYIFASRFLTFSLFGLLTYVEPILLVLVAIVLLRESILPDEYLTYGAIGIAIVLLAVEGMAGSARREPRHPPL